MTREEAIRYLIRPVQTSTIPSDEYTKQAEAYDTAIEALSADGDIISRQKVMWILTNLSYTQCKTRGEADVIETAKTLVITMPSAQPEKRTEERTETHECDLISRQAAIKALNTEIIKRRLLDDVNDGMLDEFDTEEILKALPPSQPEILACGEGELTAQPERKTGHWLKISPAGIYECSECGKNVMTADIDAYDFCHGCGAKMEVEHD